MLGSLCEVIMLPTNGLEDIIKTVNEKYSLREGDHEWFDPDEFWYLFWCEQEFGTDCYMKIDVSERAIEEEKDWLIEYENREYESHEYEVYITKARIRVLEYIRANIPVCIDTVIMPLSY